MKIVGIRVYKADLPLVDGDYVWADGKSVSAYDSTVVAVDTDDPKIVGYGEVVPLGPNYLPSYAAGVRTGLEQLAPKLLGLDPTRVGVLNEIMDFELKGHPYVKSPLDMAFWDILGKVAGLPVSTLLGGRRQDNVTLYRAIPQRPAEQMASLVTKYKNEGYNRFQLKLGNDATEDIRRIKACRNVLEPSDVLVGDANTGWLTHDALRVVKAVEDVDVYIEQPCATFDECLIVRKKTSLPFVMDENVDSIEALMRVCREGAADVVNVKISKFGGLSKAKLAVDVCKEFGLAMTIEDTWGGDISTAAILHLASSVPSKLQFSSTDFNAYNSVKTATIDNGGKKSGGRISVPTGPGLGIEPDWSTLGQPIMCFKLS